jgi:glycosyltransferase involved in cell wall biosynthesis
MKKDECKKKLLVLWPRYDPTKPWLYKIFLDNYDAKVIFIASGEKLNIKGAADLQALQYYVDRKKILSWGFKGYRLSELDLMDIYHLYNKIRNVLKSEKWDFVLCSTQSPLHSKIAYELCEKDGIPYGVKIESWNDVMRPSLFMKIYKYWDARIIKGASVTFPHGAAAHKYVESFGRTKNNIIMPLIIKNFNKVRHGKKIKKFVYCGRLIKEKGAHLALQAYLSSELLRQHTKFVIAGDGPLKGNLYELCAQSNAGGQVEFLGAYKREDLPNILDENTIFVLTSLLEGWGVSVLEAVCLCRPVILSENVGAAYDFLHDGENGYFVSTDTDDIRQKMEATFLMDDRKYIAMQESSRRIFESFNREERIVEALNMGMANANTT